MSECNHCTLNGITVRAGAGETVTVLEDAFMWKTGKRVFVHPKSVNIKKLTRLRRERYFVAWFASIPAACECSQ